MNCPHCHNQLIQKGAARYLMECVHCQATLMLETSYTFFVSTFSLPTEAPTHVVRYFFQDQILYVKKITSDRTSQPVASIKVPLPSPQEVIAYFDKIIKLTAFL